MNVEGCGVVIVEDDMLIGMALSMMLSDMGMEVRGQAVTAAEAVSVTETCRPDLVLMDVRLKGEGDGVDAAQHIHRTMKGTKVVFITGSRERETIARIQEDHPAGLLIKPITQAQLEATVRAVLAA